MQKVSRNEGFQLHVSSTEKQKHTRFRLKYDSVVLFFIVVCLMKPEHVCHILMGSEKRRYEPTDEFVCTDINPNGISAACRKLK